MKNSPVIPPGDTFPQPASSPTQLHALRCFPATQPYLPSDPSVIVLSSQLTHQHIAGAEPIHTRTGANLLRVAIHVSGHQVAGGVVPLNSTTEHAFSLAQLTPRTAPYEVTCTATLGVQTFTATSTLAYLSPNQHGSVTKRDLRTGALLVRAKGEGEYEPLFPVGFYTAFDGYLAANLSLLDEVKEMG
jgi:hypothetical protein